MNALVRLLIKGLALLYLAMAVLGFLGYLGIGSFPTGIFHFFLTVLGKYSIAIPILCLLFFIICWLISQKPKYEFPDDDEEEEEVPPETIPEKRKAKSRSQSTSNPQFDRQTHPRPARMVSMDGFSAYFSGQPLVIDRQQIRENKLKNLGTDYATYFGQGERNIYLPGKTVSINGFQQYFKNSEGVKSSLSQAVQPFQQSREAAAQTVHEAMSVSQAAAAAEPLTVPNPRPVPPKTFSSYQGYTFQQDRNEQRERSEREALEQQQQGIEQQHQQNRETEIQQIKPDPEMEIQQIKQDSGLEIQKNKQELGLEIQQNKQKSGMEISGKQAVPAEKPGDSGWKLPGLELLKPVQIEQDNEEHHAELLEEVLATFGVSAKVVNISVGPVLTRYELSPAPGTKISKIVSLADDIALALASGEIRMEAPIPGKAAVGIEIPRKKRRTVYFREVIDTVSFQSSRAKLRVAVGKNIANETVISELEKMPHLLVAGATGSGKSIFINCLINSLLFTLTPDELRLLMVDPKIVELTQYNGIPHLLAPVVTDPKKANQYLKSIIREMENRYELFAVNGVRDIDHYNKAAEGNKLPHIVVIIDELADLMMVASNEIEESICRLAQMSRAAGIHLVIATQRPSVNVITGLIKANIPSRISFAVSSQIDSRTILDSAGAEKLLGKGDMLYSPIGLGKPQRVHGCFIDEQEVKNVIAHWKSQGRVSYDLNEEQIEEAAQQEKGEEFLDDKFTEAGQLVIATGIASVSFLQRRLRVGYSRAARLMDMLEEAGVVSASDGNKPRDILMSLDSFNENFG